MATLPGPAESEGQAVFSHGIKSCSEVNLAAGPVIGANYASPLVQNPFSRPSNIPLLKNGLPSLILRCLDDWRDKKSSHLKS